jgi:putative DNA primase/helicase
MEVNFNQIPDQLKRLSQWVNWTVEERGGKVTKIPINPKTGGQAQSNNPLTWGTFNAAVERFRKCENDHIEGIGFMLSGNGLCGLDLDDCIDEDGNIYPLAKEIVNMANSYTEVTPSGKGLRIFAKGELPTGRRKKADFEVYNSGRFLTVTGNHLEGTPATIEQRDKEISEIHRQMFGTKKATPNKENTPSSSSPLPDDSALLHRAMNAANGERFKKLWEGDSSNHPSPSEADLALCSMLAFWTNNDGNRIDRLFRQSKLMRPKWDEKHFADGRTYGQVTIQKAIEQTHETYSKPETKTTPSTGSLLNYNLTDAGNAECFKDLYADQYVFVREKKKWLTFDGIRWTDDNGQALLRMLDTVRLRGRQAMELLLDLESRKSAVKWSLSSESRMKLSAALSIAESMISQSITSFDADPWLLCCENGAVDLRTGNLLTPTKGDWFYKSTNVSYAPEARCERFLQFLEEVFSGDKCIIDFVQKAIGYSLTALTVEQVLFILYGTGANGKSVFLNLIGDLLGDYSITTPASTFKDNPYHDAIPNDIARMAGARLVKSIEVKEGTRLNEERIKALTGGDQVTARFLHNEFFDFTPICKFWIAVNHKPVIRGSDEAIWRRIRLIPFEVFFPPERRDPHLNEKLRSELPGILTWAVEGCLKWQKDGLEPVGKVKEWTDSYRAESDLIAQFLEEKTEKTLTGRTKAGDLYKAYTGWCQEHGEYAITGKKFSNRLEEKGFSKKKDSYVFYHGVELL